MVEFEFINTIKKQVEGLELTIPLPVLIAQAALESGWGESGLTKYGNALFGIKAGKTWNGKVYNAKTKEVYNGKVFNTTALFRAYDSWRESIEDYVKFLTGNPRYLKVITTKDPYKACDELQNAGYATDPDYARKLKNIIITFNLNGSSIDYVDTDMENPDISKYIKVTKIVWDIIDQLELLEGERDTNYGAKDLERVNNCKALLNTIYGIIVSDMDAVEK